MRCSDDRGKRCRHVVGQLCVSKRCDESAKKIRRNYVQSISNVYSGQSNQDYHYRVLTGPLQQKSFHLVPERVDG